MVRLSVGLLFLGLVSKLWAVDLKALEALSIEATSASKAAAKTSEPCIDELPAEVSQDLPPDFDSCVGSSQFTLMKQGLYLAYDGTINTLPAAAKRSPALEKVMVPNAGYDPVGQATSSPIVLDIESIDRSIKVAQGSEKPTQSDGQPVLQRTQPDSVVKSKPQEEIRLGCPHFATFSHRGSYTQPENSEAAVVEALLQGHSGVEIDVQQLSDGTWVVHHDLTTGRTTYGGQGHVSAMSAHQWKQIRLKNRQGRETQTPAPFLKDVLLAFKKSSYASQVLNIEIKSGLQSYSCQDLSKLGQVVQKSLVSNQYLFSSRSVEYLSCLRAADSKGYLGLVVDPHPDSVREEPQGRPKSGASKLLSRLSEKVDLASGYQQQSNRSLLGKETFTDLEDLIGPNYGLHIDYRDYPLPSAKGSTNSGRIVLYQLNDDAGLQTLLSSLRGREIAMPDGVLVDATRSDYCQGDSLANR